jgi:uncharacterized protein YkwD
MVRQVPSHRAPGRPRISWRGRLLLGGLTVAAVVLAGVYLLGQGAGPATGIPAIAPSGVASCSAVQTDLSCAAASGSSPRGSPASTGRSGAPGRKRHLPRPVPSTPAPTATSASVYARAVASVLATINQARAKSGLPAYTVTGGLDVSAGKHNLLMAGGCGLSHQCPGEPSLGDRETAAGVHWTAAGENIGEGGPIADTAAAIAEMAVTLTNDMLNEKPPNDGHRLNLLSSTFTHTGIAVYRDSRGTVWLTQDFSN